MEPTKSSNKVVSIVVGCIVVIAIVLVLIFAGKKFSSSTATDQTALQNNQVSPADVNKQPVAYKDGTYTAVGSYMSPGGEDQISVTLTLANNIITDASVTPEPGDHMSAKYQSMFASGYKQYVVGQNINIVNLVKVSGSSLTPKGFDDALAQIKSQAQA